MVDLKVAVYVEAREPGQRHEFASAFGGDRGGILQNGSRPDGEGLPAILRDLRRKGRARTPICSVSCNTCNACVDRSASAACSASDDRSDCSLCCIAAGDCDACGLYSIAAACSACSLCSVTAASGTCSQAAGDTEEEEEGSRDCVSERRLCGNRRERRASGKGHWKDARCQAGRCGSRGEAHI